MLNVSAELSGTRAPLGEVSQNFISRAQTTATVEWPVLTWERLGAGAAGAAQRTPNLGVLLQEVVSRPDWASGHAVLFVITGTGQRVATSIDGNPAGAAVMSVTYQ